MKAIKVNNTTIELEFDTPEQRQQMVKLLSYAVPGAQYTALYQSNKWDGTKCYLTDKNRIKIGLFKSLFPTHSLVYDKDFKQLSFNDIPLYKTFPSFEKRDYQLQAINTILQNKIMIVKAIMGAGKSLIAAATISYHLSLNSKNKILFIVYDNNILSQSIKNFTSYGFTVSQFGNGIKDLSGDIVVATIQSLNNIKNPKSSLKHISFIFLDEVHHGKSKTSRKIISKIPNAEYFIGLTATPHEKRSIETADLTSIVGIPLFEYGFKQAVEDKKIVPVKAFFLDIEPDLDIKELVFDRKNYKYIWDTAIQDNTVRNKQIADILSYCIELLDTPNLVLIDRVEHGNNIFSIMSSKSNIKATTMFGEDDIALREIKRTSLQADNINTLISTVISEGIDFKISPVIAINATGRKGFIKLIQFLGRITRKNEKFGTFRCYVDFIDSYNFMLRNHSKQRIKACEDFGIEVIICKSIKELILELIKHYKACKEI